MSLDARDAASGEGGVAVWKPVCRLDELPHLGARRVARGQGLPVAVFRGDGDKVFALLDRCPHRAGPLSQGIVFGDRVACPLHNWTIGLATGCAQAPDEGCTPTFSVRVHEGVVWLDAQELASRAVDLPPAQSGPSARACTRSAEAPGDKP